MKNVQRAAVVFFSLCVAAFAARDDRDAVHPGRKAIGITVESLSRKDKQEKGVSFGVLVTDVRKDGPAGKAGVVKGDVIQYCNGEKISRPGNLVMLIQETGSDSTARIKVVRGSETRELTVAVIRETDGGKDSRVMVVKHLRQKVWMGVRLHGLDEDLAGYFRVKAGEGALVLGVEKDSPASKAGVKSGDVIVRIGKEKVYEPGDVSDIIGGCEPGDKIEAVAVRKGVETSLTVELEESPNRFFGMVKPFSHFEWNTEADGPFRFHGEPFSKEQWEEWSKELDGKMKDIQIRHREIMGKNREKLETALKELEGKMKHPDDHFETTAEI